MTSDQIQIESRPPHRGWWSRNWKWMLPVGCLLPVLLCGGFVTAILMFVFGLMKSSEPYQHAMTLAKSDSAVVATIGSPVEAGFFVTGSINTTGSSGSADMAIPISGPKGSGTIHVVATEAGGVWSYSTLAFQPSGSQERINLNARP